METGTVREIGAKLGDVLERSDGGDVGHTFEVMDNCHLKVRYGSGDAQVISRGWYWNSCIFRIISRATPQPDLTGPVRTVTRKEIVPGVYGKVQVFGSLNVSTELMQGADELRAAIATLTQIADALEARDA